MSLFIAEPPSPQSNYLANESNVIETEVRLNASNKHDEVSYIHSAPLIRSRLWRFINLLTYLHIRPTHRVFTHVLFTVCDAAVNYKNLGLFITEQQRIKISSKITFTIKTWESEISIRIESAATIRIRIETRIESADSRLQLQC